ncbi:hypothetical protein PPTG_23079 [Phytophthora nicotianae INRA-310]|uniref:Uncharacterized protein n=1 Tax=Phytophthora nicotianae (strain INRA-310) TaxID=761204 RepID=W2Q4Y1_PHYN3|nr:hypothetical protein PPTG_23079 [Phytophthora nicotianae INRA-310]ETN08253.1 hypothetical protein PPTG_23079 [Phytophthora nicotianae INRA-310]
MKKQKQTESAEGTTGVDNVPGGDRSATVLVQSTTLGFIWKPPVFAHGQLYVALSPVTSKKVINIAIDPKQIDEGGMVHTRNIVCREIFE